MINPKESLMIKTIGTFVASTAISVAFASVVHADSYGSGYGMVCCDSNGKPFMEQSQSAFPGPGDGTATTDTGTTYDPSSYGQTVIGSSGGGQLVVDPGGGLLLNENGSGPAPVYTLPDGSQTILGNPGDPMLTPGGVPQIDTSEAAAVMQRAMFDTGGMAYFPSELYTTGGTGFGSEAMTLESISADKANIFGELTGSSNGLANTSEFDVQASPLSWLPPGSTIAVTDYLGLIDVTSVSGSPAEIPENLVAFGLLDFSL